MSNPVVSVVMPTYNAEVFVDAAVASIRSQTFTDFELITVDDGSDDHTVEILLRHAADDRRVQVLRKPHRGICETLNDAIAVARGAYVARMDADDIALPYRLERQVAALLAQPSVAVVGSNYEIIDATGAKLGASDLPTDSAQIRATLERCNCIAHPTVLIRRDTFVAVGGYRRAFRQCEDYDLWVRLSARHELINLAEPLLRYRRHPGQLEWRDVEQRALSMLGVRASAQRRRDALPDPAERFHQVTREYLHEVGMDDRSISEGVTRWAIDAAAIALAAGQRRAARNALAVAARQPHLRISTRLRCCLIRARSFAPSGRQG
ncbi:MAG: glycosyltransferase [Candidatus Binataceae bacterium]